MPEKRLDTGDPAARYWQRHYEMMYGHVFVYEDGDKIVITTEEPDG